MIKNKNTNFKYFILTYCNFYFILIIKQIFMTHVYDYNLSYTMNLINYILIIYFYVARDRLIGQQ